MSDKLVIIIGMHRSGTSILTRISNLLGLKLEIGEFVPPIKGDNDTGFWELQEVVDVNESILNNFGISHLDAEELPSNWLDNLEKSEKSHHYIEKIEEILSRTTDKDNFFGIKDPRISRLLPLWTKCCKRLDIEPVFIFSLRSPIEVAQSLHKRNNITVEQALDLWNIYNQEAEFHSRNFKRYFVSFPDIMNSWERDMLEAEEYLDIKWNYNSSSRENINNFIQNDLYRNKNKDSDIKINNETKNLYKGLYTKSLIQESLENNEMEINNKLSQKNISENSNQRICIATPDIIGPTRNGGIGTAYYNMALCLSEQGFKVTILYLLGHYEDNNAKSIDNWVEHYKELNIELVPLEIPLQTNNLEISKLAYKYLNENSFDIVHFPDWMGLAYYSTIAKRTGTDFKNTTICIGLHSPTKWHNQFNDNNNSSPINKIEQNYSNYMEEHSVSLADVVISPSKYLVDWYKENDWKLPSNIKVIQNISYQTSNDIINTISGPDVKEIVFFGRLEIRKGVGIFCNAIKALDNEIKYKVNFTFLGKISNINGKNSDEYIKEELANSNIKYRIIDNLHSDEAVKYLTGYGRVAVIASLMENSPYVLLEVMSHNIAFISSNKGGMIELIDKKYSDVNCFTPDTKSLLKKIEYILENQATSAELAIGCDETKKQWLDFHKNTDEFSKNISNDDLTKEELYHMVNFLKNLSDEVLELTNSYLRISGDVEHQKNIIEKHNQTIKDKNSDIQKLNKKITNLNNEAIKYEEIIGKQINELEARESQLKEQKTDYEKTLEEHKKVYDDIINSTSWKITKPLRNVSSKLNDKK